MPMPDEGLKFTLEKLGLKQGELAALMGVAGRTVSQWATGAQPLPEAVAGYLRLFEAARPSTRRRELDRLPSRSKKLDEGIYRIAYHGKANGEAETDHALAVLRNGKILGSDRHGGLFTGSYEFEAARDLNIVHLRIEVPPFGTLVNGFAADENGAVFNISCKFERPAPIANTTMHIVGRPIDIALSYVSPLPN